MANHVELKSSYYFDEGLQTLGGTSKSYRVDTPNIHLKKEASLLFKTKFTASSHISKTIIDGLGSELKTICEGYSSRKLASQINKAFDEVESLSIGSCSKQLEGYDFNPSKAYKTGVKTKFFIKPGSHKGNVIFHIHSFVPTQDLKIPKQATNFKIEARLVSISDLRAKSDDLVLLDPKQDGKVGFFQTPMLPILKMSTQPMTSQLRLLDSAAINDNVSTVLVVGVKFYEYVNKNFSLLHKDGMMSIIKVF